MAGPRGVYRSIHCSLIDDPDFQELASDARLVFLTLRLSRDCNVASIFRFYIGALSEQTGLDSERIELCLKELERTGWLRWDSKASVVWIKNGLRYTPGMENINEKQAKGVINHLNALPHTELIKEFLLHYPYIESGGIDRAPIGGRGAIDRGSGGYSELKPTPDTHSIPVSVSGSVTGTESVSLSEGDESPIFGDTGEEDNPPSREEAAKVAKALREAALEATGGKGKLQPEFHDTDRIMVLLSRSNYTPEDLLAMIEFARGDPFWRAHVLSGGDLEKHADTLYAKMQAAEPPKEQGRPQPPMVNLDEFAGAESSSSEHVGKVVGDVLAKLKPPGSTTP